MRILVLLLVSLLAEVAGAFVSPRPPLHVASLLSAKKKKKQAAAGQGFGKKEEPVVVNVVKPESPTPSSSDDNNNNNNNSFVALKSIDQDNEENLSSEERAQALLRGKYGLRTYEEQQFDQQQLERRREEQTKWAEMKRKAETNQDFDLFQLLPAPVTLFIDRFLKTGLVVCGTLFVLAGIGITAEAWSKTSGEPLPDDIDQFIVNVVEPNFTPGLLVLLGFSISLGIFASLQLGSEGATYRED